MAYTICTGLRLRFKSGAVCDLPDVIAYEETQEGLLYTSPRHDKTGREFIGDEVHFLEWSRIDSFVGYQSTRWKHAENEIGEASVVCYPNLRPKEGQFARAESKAERPPEFRYPRTHE